MLIKWLLLLGTVSLGSSLFAEDAGVFDFIVATAGHGVVTKVVQPSKDESVLTSDSTSSQWMPLSSCIVASRSIQNATVKWRRNVCTSKTTPNHAVVASGEKIFTNDAHGSVRAWTVEEGALVWDVAPAVRVQEHPRVWAVNDLVAATFANDKGNDVLALYNAADGRSLGTIEAKVVGGNGLSRWLFVMPHATKEGVMQALVAHVSTKHDQIVASKVTLVELAIQDDSVNVISSSKLSVDSTFLVSTLEIQRMEDKDWHAVALDAKSNHLVQFSEQFSQVVDISSLHPLWTSIVSILPTPDSGMIRVVGRDNRYSPARDSMALFRFDGTTNIWDQWYAEDGDEETQFRGIAYCPVKKLVVALEHSGKVNAFNVKPVRPHNESDRLSRGERHHEFSPLTIGHVVGDSVSISERDAVTGYQVLSCEEKSMTILLTTAMGTTVQQTVSRNDESGNMESTVVWTAEEGLGKVSDALLLDASHPASVLDAVSEEEEAEAVRRLSFSARLQSQIDDVFSFFSPTGSTTSRDIDFGFVKVALLLSQSAHRVWGIPTSGPSRGTVAWTVDLPPSALWHSLVHGTSSSKAEVHGINGGTHSPEVLVLSSFADSTIEWTCLDGTTGEVHSSAVTTSSSLVVQVMPLFGGFGMCRQLAVLVHKDMSISVVPWDENGKENVREHIRANKNGLYTHIVDRDTNVLQSFEIVEEDSTFVAKLVGRADFPGERILKVTYPNRDEVVQTPCHILGDDSLLLKYLNPHLAVIVTVSAETESSKRDELWLALNSVGSDGKRKPAGVTPPGQTASTETKAAEDAPNLFVNVVDTVSGRVLYRASHSNASPEENIPVLISENWVFYAFFNEKIRRTEVGVLTLYEGMIDKKGLTAFHSPEQSLTFSSLEARDAKPVVLSKTYVLPKPITALGITSTRGGISSRHVILATGDDRLMTVPRHVLEPRRPTGDVKESEKEEGLVK